VNVKILHYNIVLQSVGTENNIILIQYV